MNFKKPGRFGKIPLGKLCDRCNLESPNIVVEMVCASQRQLWSVVWCIDCGMKGLMNVSINENVLELYHWNANAPVARHWLREWAGWDI